MTDKEMVSAFRERHQSAATKPTDTCVFMPSRHQCRAEAYAKGYKICCGACEKSYVSSNN